MFKPMALSLILSVATISSASIAAPLTAQRHPGEFDIAKKCPELSLVAAQKEQLKSIFEQTKTKLMTQKKTLVESKKALMAALADANVTEEVVVGHQNTVKSNVSEMLDTMFASVNQVAFTVLQKEQRPQAVACFQKIKKEWKQKWLEKKCASRTTPAEEDIDTELGEI